MARFSAREGRWITKPPRYSSVPMPDPYDPSSPGYSERTRETATDIGGGITRVDIGQPATSPKTA